MASANVTYCTVKDVENFLNMDTLSEATTPKKSTVEQFIHQAEDEIDFRTMSTWREKYRTLEYDYPVEQFYRTRHYAYNMWFDGLVIPLTGRGIKQLSSTYGDEFKLYQNATFEDWLSDKTQGLSGDYWIMPENGILHVKKRWAMHVLDKIKITYRYGNAASSTANGTVNATATTIGIASTRYFQPGPAFVSTSNGTIEQIYFLTKNSTQLKECARGQHGTTAVGLVSGNRVWQVPADITKACVLITSIALTHNDFLSVNENFGPGMAYESIEERIRQWRRESDEILSRHTEMVRIT